MAFFIVVLVFLLALRAEHRNFNGVGTPFFNWLPPVAVLMIGWAML